jgi:hypothetical protein
MEEKEVSDKTGWKPASSAEEEKTRFDTMMADFLKEDEQPPKGNQQTGNQQPPQPNTGNSGGGGNVDIGAAISRALDEREEKTQTKGSIEQLRKDVDELKKRPDSKKKPWWSPLFS